MKVVMSCTSLLENMIVSALTFLTSTVPVALTRSAGYMIILTILLLIHRRLFQRPGRVDPCCDICLLCNRLAPWSHYGNTHATCAPMPLCTEKTCSVIRIPYTRPGMKRPIAVGARKRTFEKTITFGTLVPATRDIYTPTIPANVSPPVTEETNIYSTLDSVNMVSVVPVVQGPKLDTLLVLRVTCGSVRDSTAFSTRVLGQILDWLSCHFRAEWVVRFGRVFYTLNHTCPFPVNIACSQSQAYIDSYLQTMERFVWIFLSICDRQVIQSPIVCLVRMASPSLAAACNRGAFRFESGPRKNDALNVDITHPDARKWRSIDIEPVPHHRRRVRYSCPTIRERGATPANARIWVPRDLLSIRAHPIDIRERVPVLWANLQLAKGLKRFDSRRTISKSPWSLRMSEVSKQCPRVCLWWLWIRLTWTTLLFVHSIARMDEIL